MPKGKPPTRGSGLLTPHDGTPPSELPTYDDPAPPKNVAITDGLSSETLATAPELDPHFACEAFQRIIAATWNGKVPARKLRPVNVYCHRIPSWCHASRGSSIGEPCKLTVDSGGEFGKREYEIPLLRFDEHGHASPPAIAGDAYAMLCLCRVLAGPDARPSQLIELGYRLGILRGRFVERGAAIGQQQSEISNPRLGIADENRDACIKAARRVIASEDQAEPLALGSVRSKVAKIVGLSARSVERILAADDIERLRKKS